MARFNEQNVTPVLDAADAWRRRCLVDTGSIFTDEPLWIAENIRLVDHYFVQNPLVGKEDFLTKFEQQLGPAPPAVQKLTAEMLWVMFLFPRNMGGDRKRENILKVWSWSRDALNPDHPMLGDPLNIGIGNTGTAFHTLRYKELQFLVRIITTWLLLDLTERRSLIDDPWKFGSWLSSQQDADHRQLREILPYLVFPDSYERIASKNHKQEIVNAFGQRVESGGESLNLDSLTQRDHDLFTIRKHLEAEHVGQDVDFYFKPWMQRWREAKKKKKSESLGRPFDKIFNDRKEAEWFFSVLDDTTKILGITSADDPLFAITHRKDLPAIHFNYGPWLILGCYSPKSGSRRLRAAFEEERAVALGLKTEGEPFAAKGNDKRITLLVIPEEELPLWDEKYGEPYLRAVELTKELFEDRSATNFRHKHNEELGRMIFDQKYRTKKLTEGLSLVNGTVEPYGLQDALSELFVDEEELASIRDALLYKKTVILQGPPGVGKTFMAKKLAYTIMGEKDESRVQMIQFHQSYSYEDFIQGYRPTDTGDFHLKNGVFYDFAKRAQRDRESKRYFFIIDEINRANLGKVFGELMLLVEADKRGPSFAVPLTYAEEEGDTFYLPKNLHIIGTMNTADRSLSMVDYALRRRFRFIHLEPQFGYKFRVHLSASGVEEEIIAAVVERVEALNAVIEADTKNLGRGFKIGHSFFCPLEQVEDSAEWYNRVIDLEIAPQLEEYWFDDPERAGAEADKLRWQP